MMSQAQESLVPFLGSSQVMADSNINPLSPRDKLMYEQEYRQGAELFQKALKQHMASDNKFQEAEFQDVMDQSLNVLNEAARGLMRQELLKQNQKISDDYQIFKQYPGDPVIQSMLNEDLDQAKKLSD
jgi:Ni,Fe-hydrogenase III large subunit